MRRCVRRLHAVAPDERRDYGEPRFITVGELRGRFVVSMRLCHAKEAERWRAKLDAEDRGDADST
jgi:uncharacterized DUF497 family protein